MDPIERAEIIAAGFDPDDPNVIQALDFVRWDLSLLIPPDEDNPET